MAVNAPNTHVKGLHPTKDKAERPILPAVIKGVKCRCPRCGEGQLFNKWLKVAPACNHCGEELHYEKAQDLPPYITIMIVGHVIVTLIMILEANFDLSLWTHLALWIPISTIMTLAIMQPVKGGVVGLQWALRMFGFGDGKDHG
ncbi:MAG: DUF983 domain-containing protein [Pseudomonadota bacterium]